MSIDCRIDGKKFPFISGKYYEVIGFQPEDIQFITEYSTGWLTFDIKKGYDYVWDYFYTVQELRKLKLEKIVDINEK